jgi:hypothetical protein
MSTRQAMGGVERNVGHIRTPQRHKHQPHLTNPHAHAPIEKGHWVLPRSMQTKAATMAALVG